jgi:diaminopimelate decarboxylase
MPGHASPQDTIVPMDQFPYRDRQLFCEDVPVADLAAAYGTPLFVYSSSAVLNRLVELQTAFAAANPLICYSIKSKPNIHLARLVGNNGSGFDVTSAGELFRALEAGGTGDAIVFAGTGKTDAEMRYGLETGVVLFNVESAAELSALSAVAAGFGRPAPVALRVNPDLPPKTHAKTDTSVKGVKFGLDIDTVIDVAAGVVGDTNVRIIGLHMHLGSPILSSKPYKDGCEKAVSLIASLRKQGHPVEYLNMGGGFGIHYRQQEALPAVAFAEVILPAVREAKCKLVLEPGRFIVGNAGILVSRVIFTKDSGGKHFVIQDGGMNDLIRPTLYEAFHRVWPVASDEMPLDPESEISGTTMTDVVGPVCESGDFFAKDRRLPPLARDDLLAVFSAGAYGMSMSSNYNSRPRAAEVLVEGSRHRLIRRRESLEDLIRCEREVG